MEVELSVQFWLHVRTAWEFENNKQTTLDDQDGRFSGRAAWMEQFKEPLGDFSVQLELRAMKPIAQDLQVKPLTDVSKLSPLGLLSHFY